MDHDQSLSDFEANGLRFIRSAIEFDQKNDFETALACYQEGTYNLLKALESGSSINNLEDKIKIYLNRAEAIGESLHQKSKFTFKPAEADLSRAQFLLNQALDEDQIGHSEEAVELYLDAVDLCLKVKGLEIDESLQNKISKLANEALSRAEILKSKKNSTQSQLSKSTSNFKPDLDLNSQSSNSDLIPQQSYSIFESKKGLIVVGQSNYTKEEVSVLRKTSQINNNEYLPFLNIDLRERFAFPLPFTDKNGFLPLSDKQRRNLAKWARLEDLCPNPSIIKEIDCFSIKQTLVSDCSFIASLTVASLYEKRFKKKIITSIIYPQNSNQEPVYNPCGKYMVRLHINGLDRKVIIDDFLPVDNFYNLLCSHSVNKDEFWVSLLEKAYMKVMGGYDFPGSNSSIDLNALTGWIPERISLNDQKFDANKFFRLLLKRYHRGDVLLTVATGSLSRDIEEKFGLVANHAYALLDIREEDGNKLFLLMNPWRHLRWRGNFSDEDLLHWTPSLQQKLNYNPQKVKNFDIGVFWIDYSSLCQFFETVHLNWKCSLFKYTYCTHDSWSAGTGPAKDCYNFGHNPQYHLNVTNDNSSVWVLLTRHIVDKNDFAVNKEFITVLVYKGFEKVYLPMEPPPFIDGIRINSPHYLCKITISEKGSTNYILVISQYEKTTTINFTLRAYSTSPFTLQKLSDPYKYTENVTNDAWNENTAGGCVNYPDSYSRNPVYQLELNGLNEINNDLFIELKGPKQFCVGFDVKTILIKDAKSPNYFAKASSGSYRSGFTILKLSKVPAGTYHVIPTTFLPNQKGPFFLTIRSTCPFKLTKIR